MKNPTQPHDPAIVAAREADPFPGLWAEWQSIKEMPAAPDAELDERSDRQAEIEKEMAKRVPLTPAGAAALVHLLRDYASENGPPLGDDRQDRIYDNLIAGLENMGGAVPLDASFTDAEPAPANDTSVRRAFDAVKHHPAVATVATIAVIALVAAFQNGGAVKGIMAGMIGCAL